MNRWALALVGLVAGLVLLGATTSDWAVTTQETSFAEGDADGGGGGEAIVIERTDATNGAAVAGALVPIALGSLLLALVGGAFPRSGWLLGVAGGAGIAIAVAGIGAAEGEVTRAPTIAIAAAGVLLASGVGLGILARRGPATNAPARQAPPSRYTVEAVRGEVATEGDEWDLAVADEQIPVEDDS